MTATYDDAEVERLISEARALGSRDRQGFREAMADQLEAARSRIADLERQITVRAGEVSARHTLLIKARTELEAAMARIADLETALCEAAIQPDRDRCMFCLGHKGGKPGMEQVIHGALACIHCYELLADLIQVAKAAEVHEVENDEDAADLGAMLKHATATAAEHQRQEDAGERVSLVTPFGGTVTDPDEIEMYQAMRAQNIAVCGSCMNTGWVRDQVERCGCPAGVFLGKKLAQI